MVEVFPYSSYVRPTADQGDSFHLHYQKNDGKYRLYGAFL